MLLKYCQTKIFLFALVIFFGTCLILPNHANAGSCSSTGSGNWATAATWGGAGSGCSGTGGIPSSTDDVTITAGHTVTMDGNPGAALSLTINGTADWQAARTTNIGTGGVTINSGGNITGSVAGILTTTGNVVVNANLTSTAVSITMQTTAGLTISGTGTIPFLTISTTVTNTGTLTVSTTLAGAGTLTNDTNATLYIGASTVTPTLTATANPNTVSYNRANTQTTKATTYHHLIIEGSNTKTQGGATTVNGNLTISNGATYSVGNTAVTVSGDTSVSGTLTFTYYTGTKTFNNLTINNDGAMTYTAASVMVINGSLDVDGSLSGTTGAWTFQKANGTGTIGGDAASVTIASAIFSYNYTLSGTYVITGTATFNTPVVLTNNGNYTVGGFTTSTGTWTQGNNSTLNYKQASITPTLNATATGNTVNYINNYPTTIYPTTYYNLQVANSTSGYSAGRAYNLGGNTTVTNVFTAGPGGGSYTHVFSPNGNTLTLSNSGTPFVLQSFMTITASGIINYTGNGATNIVGTNYATLQIGNDTNLSNSNIYSLTGDPTITTLLSIGPSSGNTQTLSAGSYTINLTGASGTMTINASGAFNAGTSNVSYRGSSGANVAATSYYNLTINSSGDTFTALGDINVTNVLYMTAGTFTGVARTITLTGTGTPYSYAAATLAGSMTINYTGDGATNITGGITYYALSIGNATTQTDNRTYTLINGNITVTNVLTVGPSSGDHTQSFDASTYTITLSTLGNSTEFVINSKGNFIANQSTVSYTAAGTTTNITGTTYYNLYINNNGDTFLAAGDIVVQNVFTINAGTFNAQDKTITLSASGTPFVKTGGLTQSTSTFIYSGTSATNIASATYYKLTLGTGVDTATYTLGGAVTVSNYLTINTSATLSLSSQTLTISAAGSSYYTNNGTFDPSTGRVTYSGAGGVTIVGTSGGMTYYNMTVGSGTNTYDLGADTLITNTLTVSATTTFRLNGQTLTMSGTGTVINNIASGAIFNASQTNSKVIYSGNGATNVIAATYYNLEVGDDSNTVTYSLTGTVIVSNSLKINTNATLDLVAQALTYNGTGTSLTNNGTLTTSGAGTFIYSGDGDTTMVAGTFYNLRVGFVTTNTAARTYTLGGDVSVSNILTVGQTSGTYTNIFDASSRTVTLSLSGTVTPFVINARGSFTESTSTIHFTGTGAITMPADTYNNLTLSNGTGFIAGNIVVNGDFTINSGAVFTPSAATNIVSGSGTITGQGTIKVTRIAATADLNNQYTISNKTLTNLIVDYAGAGTQTINNYTYGGLVTSGGSGTKSLSAHTTVGNGGVVIGAGTTLDATASYYNLIVSGNWTNSGTFTARNATVTFNGTSKQTLSGTMTGTSAYYNLTLTNTSGADDPGCGTSFTPGIAFASSATATNNYTIITGSVRVEYNSGSTYTFANINWNGGATGTRIFFRNSVLNSGTWLLAVSGTQTAVLYLNVAGSDASGGNIINAADISNVQCVGTNTNWTFLTVPDPPTIGTATRGNGQATVAFTPPGNDGGSAITGYTATSNPGGITGAGAASPITVAGLTNGTAYTFTVTATNAIGTSAASGPSNSVTPATVPGAPTALIATVSNTQIPLSWTAPVSDGGSAITDYIVEYKLASEPLVWTTFNDGISAGTSATVTGLTNGLSYDFRVSAVNDVGTGAASDIATETPATVPGAPTNLATTVRDQSIELAWSAPASNGGSAITDYVVEYKLTTGGVWAVFDDGVGIDTTTTVTSLSNGDSYDFRVSAVNNVGQGASSTEVSATPGPRAQVFIQSFSDLTSPSIATAVRITNDEETAYDYHYTWCVTDSDINLCGGGDDIFSSTAAILIQPHQNFDTTLNSTVGTAGNYYFHLSVRFGSDSSQAYQSFTAVVETPVTPPVTPPSGGGGGGGAYIPPVCIDADFNHDGKVSSIDFSILLSFWKTTPPFKNSCVDINGDKQVNSVDFSILLYQWGRKPILFK